MTHSFKYRDIICVLDWEHDTSYSFTFDGPDAYLEFTEQQMKKNRKACVQKIIDALGDIE